MNRISAIFAGQGSQYAGMGAKLIDYPEGKKTFQEANDILDMDLKSVCCIGTNEELSKTEITQPAIVTCSIAAFRILLSGAVEIKDFAIDEISVTAGLSVGEYSALVASEVLSFGDAIKLVKERGRLMAEASAKNPGIMVAVLGLDAPDVKSICEEASSYGIVQPANYNSPGQVVISGEKIAVEKASELALKSGAKRCISLDVSGAFHSPLMKPAESRLRKALSGIQFSAPKIPFVANVTGNYISDAEVIRENLALQLSNSIQWELSISQMISDRIVNFIEFGPGKVLAGLVRKINRDVKIFSSDSIIGS